MNKNKLIIMRGLPGSGKSTLAKETRESIINSGGTCVIISTDNYWVRPDGTYDFNFKLLSQAHEWTFNIFKKFLSINFVEPLTIILDNTNIKRSDFARYVELAQEKNYDVVEVSPDNTWSMDPESCAKRTIHNVPLETIQKMKDKYEK